MGTSVTRNIQVLRSARGIERVVAYYVATKMSEGVQAGKNTSDYRSWKEEEFQKPTSDYPYVWKYTRTYFTDNTYKDSTCELIGVYQSGINPNLLDDTDFTSEEQMSAWNVAKPAYNPKALTEEEIVRRYPDESKRPSTRPVYWETDNDRFGKVGIRSLANGAKLFNGHNFFSSIFYETASRVYYREILQQELFGGGVFNRIESNTWYTLSFWARGSGGTHAENILATHLFPNVISTNGKVFVNGVSKSIRSGDGLVEWELKSNWQFYTLTFQTRSLSQNDIRYLLFRQYPLERKILRSVDISMPKLEVGIVATPYVASARSYGVTARFGEWKVLSNYMAGRAGDLYHDIVSYKGEYYECLVSHTSNESNAPDLASRMWRKGEHKQFVATDLFFAKETYLKNAVVERLSTNVLGEERIVAEGSKFEIYGKGMEYPSIEIGYEQQNNGSVPILRFRDGASGAYLYDLGPTGMLFGGGKTIPHSWSSLSLIRLTEKSTIQSLLDWVEGFYTEEHVHTFSDNTARDFPSKQFDYGKTMSNGQLVTNETMYKRIANRGSVSLGYGAIFREGYTTYSSVNAKVGRKYIISKTSVPSDFYHGRAFEFDPNQIQEFGVWDDISSNWKTMSPEDLYSSVGLPIVDSDGGYRAVTLNGWYCARKQEKKRADYSTYQGEEVFSLEIVHYRDGILDEKMRVYYSNKEKGKGLTITASPIGSNNGAARLLDWMTPAEQEQVPLWEALSESLKNYDWRRRNGLG